MKKDQRWKPSFGIEMEREIVRGLMPYAWLEQVAARISIEEANENPTKVSEIIPEMSPVQAGVEEGRKQERARNT